MCERHAQQLADRFSIMHKYNDLLHSELEFNTGDNHGTSMK